jgi:hypothetical protein
MSFRDDRADTPAPRPANIHAWVLKPGGELNPALSTPTRIVCAHCRRWVYANRMTTPEAIAEIDSPCPSSAGRTPTVACECGRVHRCPGHHVRTRGETTHP